MAFFALRTELEAWLANGGAMQAFYDDHATALGITYSQFAKHTRRYLTKGKPHAKAARLATPTVTPQRKATPPSDAPPSFKHDPIAPPESDLI